MEKDARVSWTERMTNKLVREKAGVIKDKDLLKIFKLWKVSKLMSLEETSLVTCVVEG